MPIPASDPIVNVPIAIPFDDGGRVDHAALGRNVERWLETPLSGFLIGSQTGEEWFLSEDEKLAVMRTVGESLDEKRFLIGGIDCPGVTETLRRAEAFAEAGAEMVRVRFPRGDVNVESYFDQVLPRCPVPVLLMHQSVPERFGMAGPPAATAEVLGQICNRENVFGYVTDHDVRFETGVRACVGDDRRFWICNGSLILHGTLIGCNGTTTAFSNIWPAALDELLRMGMSGRYDEAQALQEKVRKIDVIMLPYRAAGVKAALKLLGFEGMRPRSPFDPMPAATVTALESVMRDAGLITE